MLYNDDAGGGLLEVKRGTEAGANHKCQVSPASDKRITGRSTSGVSASSKPTTKLHFLPSAYAEERLRDPMVGQPHRSG